MYLSHIRDRVISRPPPVPPEVPWSDPPTPISHRNWCRSFVNNTGPPVLPAIPRNPSVQSDIPHLIAVVNNRHLGET